MVKKNIDEILFIISINFSAKWFIIKQLVANIDLFF